MSKEKPTIMVVEDETLLLQAITTKLKLSGLDVISCASGQQAIDYLNNLDVLPDAIWLDWYLKDMNGLAFMQSIKASIKWQKIPVVVVSNSADPSKVNNMLALGVKKYILKAEFRLDEIIGMIRDFIDEDSMATSTPVVNPLQPSSPQPSMLVADLAAQALNPSLTPPVVAAPRPSSTVDEEVEEKTAPAA